MAQFIQRSLLLATMQLPLVSVTWIKVQKGSTVTIKFPPHWPIKYCCRASKKACLRPQRVTVSNSALTFNCQPPHGRCRCYNASDLHTQSYHRPYPSVDIELSSDYCRVNILEGHPREENSLCLCAEDHRGQCCSPIASGEKIPTLSGDQAVIRVTCDASWCLFTSNCNEMNDPGLRFYREAKSWIDALEHCHNMNGSLVQITNHTVQSAVDSLLLDKTEDMQDGVWIGLERSIFGVTIPWMWTSGLEVTDCEQWNSTFPVDRFNNHCGKIIWVKASQEFKWLDANCHKRLPFMCQGVNE
ncbi:uncharacterized protein LOC143323427 [Chaetodon auriga]|uniref:uncharacterized protein LOC143323427 n=1 Tax=Chaetodon auriga TaxID=39042 RepID=UPI004032B8F6